MSVGSDLGTTKHKEKGRHLRLEYLW
ncbi:hypothetical protein Goshw_005194, partial [Gossypium schwendimanii]|nr:hypothetical protein [Gossypium schwendimanii]